MTSLANMTPFPPPVHPYMPWVILHIAAGCFAIVAGYTAVIAAKGERLHRLAGTIFVAAMLILASVGVYLSIVLQGQLPGEISNIAGGGIAFYLVLTAYMTVKSPEGTIGPFEKLLFVMPLCFARCSSSGASKPRPARSTPSTATIRRCSSSSPCCRCSSPRSI